MTARIAATVVIVLALAIPAAATGTFKTKRFSTTSQSSNIRNARDAEGTLFLESIPKDEIVCDTAAFNAARRSLEITGPGDYLLGKGFRTGYHFWCRRIQNPPLFFYVVAEFQVSGSEDRQEVVTALPWETQGIMQFPPSLFADLFKRGGNHLLTASFHFFNTNGDTLLNVGVARPDGSRLRFPPPRRLSPDDAEKLLDSLEENCENYHQRVVRTSVQVVTDVQKYFTIVPPSPELDNKLRSNLEHGFMGENAEPFFLPKDLDCAMMSHAEYLIKGDTLWQELYEATFEGNSCSCQFNNHKPIPPGTSEIKVRFKPYTPAEAWPGNNIREYYGGTIETGWLKLDSARGDELPPARPFTQKIPPK